MSMVKRATGEKKLHNGSAVFFAHSIYLAQRNLFLKQRLLGIDVVFML